MVNLNDVGMPGTSVFDGMRSAAAWHAQTLENNRRGKELYEWDQNKDLRDVARDIAYDEAITKRAVEQESNRALRSLGRMRGTLYDGSKDGYLKALDVVNPLSGGATRRLSKDGKTIETVGVDGQVLGTTPNLSGKMAERAIIQNSGLSLLREVEEFFPREAREQQQQLQMAMAQDRTRADMLDMQMRMLAGALGMGGGLGGRGGRGGRGGAGGLRSPYAFETTDFERTDKAIARRAMQRFGIPANERGEPDFTAIDPEKAADMQRQYFDYLKQFEYNYLDLIRKGSDPYMALSATQNLLDQQDLARRAQEAQAAKAAAEADALARGIAEEAARQARALGRSSGGSAVPSQMPPLVSPQGVFPGLLGPMVPYALQPLLSR